jgi:hypothetical protein
MAGDFLDLEWRRCPEGYHLYSSKRWILPNSKNQKTYRPFSHFDALYREFAKVENSQNLLKFVTLFGPLDNEECGTNVRDYLRYAENFRELLSAKLEGPEAVANEFTNLVETEFIGQHEPIFDSPRNAPLNQLGDELGQLQGVITPISPLGEFYLVPDPEKGLEITIKPYTLMSGLWIQLSRKLSDKSVMRICRHCGKPFEAGPGTKKRADATFCCREHSVRFYSFKRSQGA